MFEKNANFYSQNTTPLLLYQIRMHTITYVLIENIIFVIIRFNYFNTLELIYILVYLQNILFL